MTAADVSLECFYYFSEKINLIFHMNPLLKHQAYFSSKGENNKKIKVSSSAIWLGSLKVNIS